MTTTRGVRASRQTLEPPEPNDARVFDLAERLAGLWHTVNRGGAGDADRVQQLLDFSTRSLRPDRPFVGLLTHLSEGTVVIDAASFHHGDAPGMQPSREALVPGNPFPFDATVHRRLFVGRRAHSWNDLARTGSDAPDAGMLGWRALIGTSFQLGAKTTFLVFGSSEPAEDDPFTENDYAFIDVLASIVANRLQEDLMRDRLRYQVEHDLLTGLPNRAQFHIALRNAVTAGRPCAIALADLDDFNSVNKINGQTAGDELLAEIGAELSEISEFDFVARVSGDRFAMLVYDVETEAAAAQHTQAYMNRFLHPFRTGNGDDAGLISIGASFGLTLFPQHGNDAEDLMRRALFALEVAKKHGRGRREFFRQDMEDTFGRHRVVRTELLAGVDADQFVLEYQPTFDLATGALRGAEALVRWNHPRQGLLLPGQFVPMAEKDNEAIGALGRWVMARAVRDLATLDHVPPGFCAYINVSPLQLREASFITALRAELEAAPHVAGCLGVEVTESAAMDNIEQCIATLQALRDLGLRVALDDFGTGYSSLAQLKRMPLNVVKIDQSFVRGLPGDPHDAVLCEAMISIADRFGFATLAEGIETPEQAAWLRDHGCRYGQGYLFGRPAPWSELESRLRA